MIVLLAALTVATVAPAPQVMRAQVALVAKARIIRGARLKLAVTAPPPPAAVIRNGLVEFR